MMRKKPMDKNNPTPIRDVQSSNGVTPDKAFSEGLGAQPPSPENQQSPKTESATEPPHKNKTPVGAIIVAIIVAGALAAATIFAYRQTNNLATETNTTETKEAATETEIENVSSEIDKTVSELDETEDFSESELSDAALGL